MRFAITHIRLKFVFLVGTALAVAFVASLFVPLPKEDFSKQSVHSLRVYDRNGILLREFLNDEQGRGQWKPLDQIAPEMVNATIAVEDRRFWLHPGVDPLAIVRAVVDNIKAGAMKAGGSTIAQQVLRNIYHRPRTIVNKAVEAWQALRLERTMTRKEVLEQYLNRAPYGNQLTGIEAASRYYFQKPASDLSLAEAAFLAGLPNSPTSLNPYQNFKATRNRQQVVLRRLLDQKLISRDAYERAVVQPVQLTPPEVNFRAPHAVQMAAADFRDSPDVASVDLTIDYPLQQNIQWALRSHLAQLKRKNVSNAAVVVIENRTGAIRALVGSADFFDESIGGQVNGATALRQPGSSVKPFLYVRALEGPFTPATVLPDLPTHIPDDRGDYIPENYDKHYHGPVRLRTALACSYNVPAVRTIQVVGIGTLYQSMQLAGITSLTEPVEYYGYGLTLGNAEVSLLELTNAYRTFPNKGVWSPSVLIRSAVSVDGQSVASLEGLREHASSRQIYDERAAFLITDILKDYIARRPAFGNAFHFPFECAVKTGTTKDYRDNWTLGYTTEYTVGVWAGNFDASPMHGVSGVTGAGQIFYDIMMLVHEHTTPPDFAIPDGLVQRTICPVSGLLPNDNCGKTIKDWFIRGKEPKERCTIHQAYRVMTESGAVQNRVYEVFPPEYRAWSDEQRIPVPPAGALHTSSLSQTSSSQLPNRKLSNYQISSTNRQSAIGNRQSFRILSPLSGDIFKLDPVLRPEYQTIKVSAAIPPEYSDVKLVINKTEKLRIDDTGAWWALKKGTQRFQLEARDRSRLVLSKPITINVE
ncbi:MAG TPA: penicillin-binding protein 1C [Bacteroidota bacterium]|nr:penicillin-binding protein 1C [Bacteroidota bacterium]